MTKPNWYYVYAYYPGFDEEAGRSGRGKWRRVAHVKGNEHRRIVREMMAPLDTRYEKAPPGIKEVWPQRVAYNNAGAPVPDFDVTMSPPKTGVGKTDFLWLVKRKPADIVGNWNNHPPTVVITISNDMPELDDPALAERFWQIQARSLYEYLKRALPDETMIELFEILHREA